VLGKVLKELNYWLWLAFIHSLIYIFLFILVVFALINELADNFKFLFSAVVPLNGSHPQPLLQLAVMAGII
jgi:uncharacterized integral membrane protein